MHLIPFCFFFCFVFFYPTRQSASFFFFDLLQDAVFELLSTKKKRSYYMKKLGKQSCLKQCLSGRVVPIYPSSSSHSRVACNYYGSSMCALISWGKKTLGLVLFYSGHASSLAQGKK